jgi:hypothetical protein
MVPASECSHEMLMLGSHPSFHRKGWLCTDCGTFQNLELRICDEYVVVFAALKMEKKDELSKPGTDGSGS